MRQRPSLLETGLRDPSRAARLSAPVLQPSRTISVWFFLSAVARVHNGRVAENIMPAIPNEKSKVRTARDANELAWAQFTPITIKDIVDSEIGTPRNDRTRGSLLQIQGNAHGYIKGKGDG